MAEALEQTDDSQPSQQAITTADWSIQLSQHFHNDKTENTPVEREASEDLYINSIPCEYCHAQINFADWEAHACECVQAQQQPQESITEQLDDFLFPCEYCLLPFNFTNLQSHMDQCPEGERRRLRIMNDLTQMDSIPCEYCLVPVSIEHWNRHTEQCAKTEEQKRMDTARSLQDDLIPCEICDKIFAIQDLEKHQSECQRQQTASASAFSGETFGRAVACPETWDLSSPYNLSRYALELGTKEYEFVANKFHATLPNQNIITIERVQNRRWYRQYDAHKDDFIERYGQSTEQWLFHGCSSQSAAAIMKDCFNRSHVVRFAVGQGIYFATDAAISLNYTQPDAGNIRHMFMARVLVGKTTAGSNTTRVCPQGYDTTGGGSVFVTYHDAQAYGEYLIAFR